MIQHVIAAPKGMPTERGLAFAQEFSLGYEVPDFMSPTLLEDPTEAIGQWQEYLRPISGVKSLHGPVYDLNPVSLDPDIAAASHKRYQQAVSVCQSLGCRYLVVHSQYESLFDVAQVKGMWFDATVAYWQNFAESVLADAPSLTVVIENFMETHPEHLRELVDAVGHPRIKACLDTGHANIYSSASLHTWLDTLEDRLVYVHSHNNMGTYDEHRGYQHGTLDMEAFLNQLIMLPQRINLVLEIFNEPELRASYPMVVRALETQQIHMPNRSFLI